MAQKKTKTSCSQKVDFSELMDILSVPRSNGSEALKKTRDALCSWLSHNRISYRLHTYKARPYFMEAIGAWMILSQLLLALAVWLRWGWPAFIVSVIGLLVIQLEAGKGVPILSRLGASQSENIVIEFSPSHPKQEIVLSAHYDSKTELMDHRQRAFFLKLLPVGVLLALALGILGAIDGFLSQSDSPSNMAYYIAIFLSIPHIILMVGLGANFALGRFVQPSQGAVDNGAACAILLALTRRLAHEGLSLQQTKVAITLFTGEEIAAQGSTAYVADRAWSLPTIALNLELMGQNGPYITWDKLGGSSAKTYPATPALNAVVAAAVTQVTDSHALSLGGPVGTDTVPFLANGIPATSMGTLDRELGDGGLHRPTDNLGRVQMERLPESVDILAHIVSQYDTDALVKHEE